MLTLPIKKKWFDMSLNGIKEAEYREIKPYWTKRFSKLFGIDEKELLADIENAKSNNVSLYYIGEQLIKYRNGYGKNAPYFIALVDLHIGRGNVKWGAPKGVCYILNYIDIIEIGNLEIDVSKESMSLYRWRKDNGK